MVLIIKIFINRLKVFPINPLERFSFIWFMQGVFILVFNILMIFHNKYFIHICLN